MIWFFEKYHDYDYYKYISQPKFIIENILNYYDALEEFKKNG